jgi:uncharacterized protein (DUF305 family)
MDASERAIAVAAPGAHPEHAHAPAAAPERSTFSPAFRRFSREMDAGMDKMMKDMHASGYTGNADVDFLAMMIPHHEGAVEMARLVLVHGKDPLTRQLAEEIIASQTAEIAAMRQRLAILRRGDDPDPGGFPALQGTRGEASP